MAKQNHECERQLVARGILFFLNGGNGVKVVLHPFQYNTF